MRMGLLYVGAGIAVFIGGLAFLPEFMANVISKGYGAAAPVIPLVYLIGIIVGGVWLMGEGALSLLPRTREEWLPRSTRSKNKGA